jgi:hypothetical protein
LGNIKVNDNDIVIEEWRWAELAYDFIKLWTSGLVTLSLMCLLERISRRDNHIMKGGYKKGRHREGELVLTATIVMIVEGDVVRTHTSALCGCLTGWGVG